MIVISDWWGEALESRWYSGRLKSGAVNPLGETCARRAEIFALPAPR